MALYYISGKTAAGAVQRQSSSRRYLSCYSIYCKSFKSIISILFLHQLLQYSFQAFLDRSDVLVVNIGCIHAAAPSSAENAGLLLNCLRHYSTPHPVFMSQKTPSKALRRKFFIPPSALSLSPRRRQGRSGSSGPYPAACSLQACPRASGPCKLQIPRPRSPDSER